MSSANVDKMVQPPMSEPDSFTIVSDDESDYPASAPETPRDTPNPATTKRQWNGDPMDWESWPIGRPGPVVPETEMQEAKTMFHSYDQARDEKSRTEEKVFHLAEFSSSGQELFVGHVTEPELAARLKDPHPEYRFRLLFATSRSDHPAFYSTYTRRVLSACGAPAAVWSTFRQICASPFHSFTDTRDGNIIFHGWQAARFQWKVSEDDLHLLSEPYLSDFKEHLAPSRITTLYPRLYYSYNATTQQITIVTTDVVRLQLCMIEHLKELCGMPIRPEEITRLLIKCFAVVQECFATIAMHWDKLANGPKMAPTAFQDSADHYDRLQNAEISSRISDMLRGDFAVFQSALIPLEQYFQDLWTTMKFGPAIKKELGALFTEQKKRCEVTGHLLDNIVSRYDRFLGLLLNYTNIRMVEGMKNVSEENAKMTAEMKELAKQNATITTTMAGLMEQIAEATTQMKISTAQNAEAAKRMKELAELNHRTTEQSAMATRRMAELAEVSRRQAIQNDRQAQSMAVLTYDTKRDSEVMKAITVVTLIFLPATFVSTIFSMGFFNFDQDQLALSRQGWIYLVCTLPLTVVVLGASFAWIWWTGTKEEKPADYSAGQALAESVVAMGLGVVAVPKKGV